MGYHSLRIPRVTFRVHGLKDYVSRHPQDLHESSWVAAVIIFVPLDAQGNPGGPNL